MTAPERSPTGRHDDDEPAELAVPGTPGIIVANAAQRIGSADRAILDWLGYTLPELTWPFVADICSLGPDWTEAEWTRFRRDGSWEGEILLRRRDGQLLPRQIRATTVKLGATEAYVSVISNPAEYDEVARAREAGAEIFAEGL